MHRFNRKKLNRMETKIRINMIYNQKNTKIVQISLIETLSKKVLIRNKIDIL